MGRRTLATLLTLFGLFAVGGVLYKERFSLRLMLFGEHASGVIVKALDVDEQNLSHSRYNLGGSGPTSVSIYHLIVQFAGPEGTSESTTRMNSYEIDDLVGGTFNIEPIRGRTVDVRYLKREPSISEVVHPLPWETFWYPLLIGVVSVVGGGLLSRNPKVTAPPKA
ncbi:MAG: hypothetical protein H6953_14265 [Chromatiaceae bacterium]|nr:hypothetical protein [Chromatiaceae bacterium]MCP5312157.1 hypothetical protein [Chromatiaceae bacterium]